MLKRMIKTNLIYEALAFVVQVLVPVGSSLYFVIADAKHWLSGEERVFGSGTLIETAFLISLYIWRSHKRSDDSLGVIEISEEEGVRKFLLVLTSDLDDLAEAKEVRFKVVQN
jgi:hypothetical protein